MFYTFASLLMLAGLLSSCAYFGIGLREKILLSRIPRKERPDWILEEKLQNCLGHLAMFASVGYVMAYMVQKGIGGKHAWPLLCIAIYFFLAGSMRFGNAHFTRLALEKFKQSSKP